MKSLSQALIDVIRQRPVKGFFVAAFFCMAKVTVRLFVRQRVSIAYPVIALFNFGMS